MPRRRRKPPSQFAQNLTFWGVIIGISLVVAFVSFRVGRDWVGKRLSGVETADTAARMTPQADDGRQLVPTSETRSDAPEKAIVVMEEREPSYGEKREIHRKQVLDEPQDGADLYREQEEAGLEEDAEEPERPEEPASAESTVANTGDVYTVTAGAYTDAANASSVISQLSSRGYKPYREKTTRDGNTLYRVNVAVVKGRAEAEELCEEIRGMGLPAGLIAGP